MFCLQFVARFEVDCPRLDTLHQSAARLTSGELSRHTQCCRRRLPAGQASAPVRQLGRALPCPALQRLALAGIVAVGLVDTIHSQRVAREQDALQTEYMGIIRRNA